MMSDIFGRLKNYVANKVLIILTLITIVLLSITYYAITEQNDTLGPDPSRIISLALFDLIVILTITIILARKLFYNIAKNKESRDPSKLQNRIIIAFSIVAAIPTIIISVFSAYFFNFGLQSWFDNKLLRVLEQSIIVGESYITEHTMQLKQTALSVADDLSEMYYDLVHDPVLFDKTLNGEAEMRSLSEAIVFQRSSNIILAQTSLSFSLSFTTIPIHLLDKADKGETVEIRSDPNKIRILVKLREYNETYLLIGRLIDNKIIDHIDKTNGAAAEYYRLKSHIVSMQIKFAIIFILVALVLLLSAISWGAIFASQIVSPIRKLVKATEKAKAGDLTVQVLEDDLRQDEIKILSTAFNRMIKQINHQQKDLIIAQRALAWSDVARRVAHEIKNPLTPIQLSAEILLRKFEKEVMDKSSFKKYISTITRHTNDITRIVSEFVNFARLPLPVFNDCEILKLIKSIIDSRRLINEKITYDFKFNESVINLICDGGQISQALLNLVKNAEEAIENITQKPQINVAAFLEDELLTITIEDNGPGFLHDLLGVATEAYITTRSKGTGLGLAITKKIVQDHLGEIEISNMAKGAQVKLTFNVNHLKSKLK
ncbi:MAG: HAMP domain-containing protein [Rickettsiaceae bacterium]|nr:MAG: HAMP domain-containing protein [Rickettsiaceae bacterium]